MCTSLEESDVHHEQKDNVDRKITGKTVDFDYPVPDGMITDPLKKAEMIRLKIKNLEESNDLFWGDLPASIDELRLVYTKIERFISDNFSGFNGLDVDWNEVSRENYENIEYSDGYGDFASVITKLGLYLQEGHTQIVPSRFTQATGGNVINIMLEKAPVIYTIPLSKIGACYTVTEDEELVISKLIDSKVDLYEFEIGDEIVGFNGVPWQDWIPALLDAEIPVFASPGANKDAIQYNMLKSGMANVNLFEKINIRRAKTGNIETMDVKYVSPVKLQMPYCTDLTQAKGLPDWRKDVFTHGKIEGTNIGYIYLRECPHGFDEVFDLNDWDPYLTSFSKEFERVILSFMDTDGLIIDVRTNDGGRPEPLYRGLARLIDSEENSVLFKASKRDTQSPDRKSLVDVVDYPWYEFRADDGNKCYKNPIIVLTGPDCISACDMLVAMLSRYDEFTIIGKQPNGSATQVAGMSSWSVGDSLSTDYVMTYLTNFIFFFKDDPSRSLMRRTDFVDHEIWFTKEDLINEVDTVREYAINLIKNFHSNDN